jgi:hypothetical protein
MHFYEVLFGLILKHEQVDRKEYSLVLLLYAPESMSVSNAQKAVKRMKYLLYVTVIVLVARLPAGQPGLNSMPGQEIFLLATISSSGVQPGPSPVGTGCSFPEGGQDMKLTIYLHLMSRSKKMGAVPPHPIYSMDYCTFMLFSLYLYVIQV